MNDDDRLHRYLSDRADDIPLAPGDPSAVMRRGSRRRTRRRGALVGGVAIVGLLATTVVIQRGNDDQSVKLRGSAVTATPSTYDWSVVNPGTGLGYSRTQAELAGGSIYGLSTAPGPVNDKTFSSPATLYRSDDGTEWVKAELPSGLSATSLAASGDTLYALGTAPAGGGTRALVVAASTDGAASWTSVKLPHELADLESRHPGQIAISTPTLAAKDATHQVVTVVVSANIDPTQLKPELAGKNYSWEWTDTGLTVYEANVCKVFPPSAKPDTANVTSTTGTVSANAKAADPTTVAADASPKSATAEAQGCRTEDTTVTTDVRGNGPVVASYTWSDLGVDSELAGLVNGHTYSYVTDDGSHFTPVDLPTQGHGWGSALVAGADGYTLFFGREDRQAKSSTTEVLHSADGHSWEAVTSFSGSPMSAGLLSGRPAVSVSGMDGQTSVQAQQADGSWMPIDLSAAVPQAAGVKSWVGDVAFGPLGLAATVSSFSERDKGFADSWIVHSTDGHSLSVLSLKEKVAGSNRSPLGITVSADAITVRLSNGPATPGHPATQTVLVGTPAG